jgi:simple sugar transport system substrate-binding protein
MTKSGLTRRSLMTATAALLGTAATGALRPAFADDKLTIGIVYVGAKGDFGWNQAHAVGAEVLKKIPGVVVVEEENVPETAAVVKTMESMIQLDNAKLIFGTSFGYFNPFMIDLAKAHPDVIFRHPTTLWSADKDPMNLGGYYGYIDQAHYVNGVAAGLSTKTNKVGFVVPKPIGVVLRDVNSFAYGVRKTNPGATVHIIITGDWSLPVREAEATNALIDAGCDVIATRVDSPKVVVTTAEGRGVKSCGYAASQADLAPKGFITGAEFKWGTVYGSFAKLLAAGQALPNITQGGYDKDYVQSTPFGAGASDAAQKAALAAIEDLKADKPIFTGPVKTNTGKVVSDKTLDLYDGSLWGTDYLVEGIVGSVT